jgi:hypothetical protein
LDVTSDYRKRPPVILGRLRVHGAGAEARNGIEDQALDCIEPDRRRIRHQPEHDEGGQRRFCRSHRRSKTPAGSGLPDPGPLKARRRTCRPISFSSWRCHSSGPAEVLEYLKRKFGTRRSEIVSADQKLWCAHRQGSPKTWHCPTGGRYNFCTRRPQRYRKPAEGGGSGRKRKGRGRGRENRPGPTFNLVRHSLYSQR